MVLNFQMGAAGFRGSLSPVFPDNGGLLFDLRDLELCDGKQIRLNEGMFLRSQFSHYNSLSSYLSNLSSI